MRNDTIHPGHLLDLKIPPPIVFLVSAGLMWLGATVIPQLSFTLPWKGFSLVAAALGGLFAGPSLWSFFRAKTTLLPEHPNRTTALVVTGVYAYSRNPMYLSLLFLLIGWAVYLENLAALIPVPLFVLYLNRFQIKPEERALTLRFGQAYEAYLKQVRRWL